MITEKLINMVSLAVVTEDGGYSWFDLDKQIHTALGEPIQNLTPKYMDSMFTVCRLVDAQVLSYSVEKESGTGYFTATVKNGRTYFEEKGMFPQTALLAAYLSYMKWYREEFDMMLKM